MSSLLYGLAGRLVEDLCSPIFQDLVRKPWRFGRQDEFERLKNTVSAIEAVLLDAEEKQRTNHQVRDWLLKIKLALYDLEDLLKECSTEALKRHVITKNKKAKRVRIFFSSSNQVNYHLKMGRKVKLIRERLDAIASDRNRFNLNEWREEMHIIRTKTREETHSFVSSDKFIGRDEDKMYITKRLCDPDNSGNLSVVSIVGIGGLGKTTLAQSIYGLVEVKCSFDLMMWVCVPNVFDVKHFCEKIIQSATKNKCEGLQMDLVKDQLKKAVDGKKYLLVLDDLWNENPIEWVKLEELLRGGAKGSKILITTRTELVARVAKSSTTYFLKELSHEKSWELFKQVAFKQGVEPESSTIVRIGKEVVQVCVGVPLAIKMIGSVLGLKEKETDWLDFEKNDLPLITQDNEGEIVPVLKLSYDKLSAPLKRCFAYCAIFPKDYGIEKETLIRMWMAHGIIRLDGTPRSLEDVGNQQFKSLFERSFFKAYGKYVDGSIRSYKMHDLIHDLAVSVAGEEYWNHGSGVNCIDKTTRHAWFTSHIPSNLFQAKKLRTLVVHDSCGLLNGQIDYKSITTFKRMRVLDLKDSNITSVPRFVGGLRLLTYLDLSMNKFDLLPESICSLYNLQTLILRWCENLKELPTGIKKLVSLRYLDISFCDKLGYIPRGLEELTSLQTSFDRVMRLECRNLA